ncbi:KdsC family phosphatase [Parapedobacter lycopersici]|uniref:KdsC family phosphatase n=1 Tax=Parapedobacter lycopersici TaxID=1864939 RepID=UPI00214DD33B|nr:HAD-IIIA family hydrolase [Parapedobacter lycopersici]
MTLFDQLKRVKAFVFDVDGVLSDGSVLVTEQGEQLRTFHTRDGYAIQLAVKRGYPIAVITGGRSLGVQKRMEGLGITDVYLDVHDKSAVLRDWLSGNQLTLADILYMGDDIPDLENMKVTGFPACPADAAEEIKAISVYISPKKGGAGAARDVIEKVMKLHGTWNEDSTVTSR